MPPRPQPSERAEGGGYACDRAGEARGRGAKGGRKKAGGRGRGGAGPEEGQKKTGPTPPPPPNLADFGPTPAESLGQQQKPTGTAAAPPEKPSRWAVDAASGQEGKSAAAVLGLTCSPGANSASAATGTVIGSATLATAPPASLAPTPSPIATAPEAPATAAAATAGAARTAVPAAWAPSAAAGTGGQAWGGAPPQRPPQTPPVSVPPALGAAPTVAGSTALCTVSEEALAVQKMDASGVGQQCKPASARTQSTRPSSTPASSLEDSRSSAGSWSGSPESPQFETVCYDQMAERYWAIDVECVASGPCHTDRAVAQISLVRFDGTPVLDLYVRPECPVMSFLTPLTGLTYEMLFQWGIPLQQAMDTLRSHLPKDAIIVGHSVHHDIRWLGLQEGQDYQGIMDVGQLWRYWNDMYQSWNVFGQEHLAKVLLGEDLMGGAHNAVGDAIKSMKLFRLHQQYLLQGEEALERAKQELLAVPNSPAFSRRFPTYEGVCMGNRKTCRCGAPFFL